MNALLSFVRWSSSLAIYRQKRLPTRIRVSDVVPHIPGKVTHLTLSGDELL